MVFNNIQNNNNSEQHNKNGINKVERPDCNKFYVDQTKKRLKDRFTQHRIAFIKLIIYKCNLVTQAMDRSSNHTFPQIENMTLNIYSIIKFK